MSSSFAVLNDEVTSAAQRLLGCLLIRRVNDKDVRVRIVEVEAYDQMDAASHSYSGRTHRTDVMFGPPGYLYVYFTYGMHYCCNIVVGPENYGAAVLIRAVEPLSEVELLERRRGKSGVDLTNGPAKVCQALDIDKRFNGHDLSLFPLKLLMQRPIHQEQVIQTKRVGISKAKHILWRFYVKDSPYVSHK